MPELPSFSSVPIVKTSVQSSSESLNAPGGESAEPIGAEVFTQILQEALELTEAEVPAGWALALPIETELPAMILASGKFLPVQTDSGGMALPFALNPESMTRLNPGAESALAEFQSTATLTSLVAQVGRSGPALSDLSFNQLVTSTLETPDDVDALGQHGLGNLSASPGVMSGRGGQMSLAVDIPVGQTGWGKAVGERIQWMVGRNLQSAEVKLTPPNLGPMEIRITLQHDTASVSFVAAQPATREALEAAIPRLREMFESTNLTLADVGVGQGDNSHAHSNGHAMGTPGSQAGNGSVDGPTVSEHAVTGSIAANGLVDDYA